MCSAHFWKRIFEKMHLGQMTCVIFFRHPNLVSGRSTQVVKTKKTRSAAVISFQVVSRRDGCSKVHSRRIWYSRFNTKTYMFGVHPQVTAEALPQMKARCAISFQYFTMPVHLHLRKSITPLIMTLLQTPQNSFWYVLRESTVRRFH